MYIVLVGGGHDITIYVPSFSYRYTKSGQDWLCSAFEDVIYDREGGDFTNLTVIVAFLFFTFSSLVSLCQLKQALNSYNINVYFSKTLNNVKHVFTILFGL